MAAYVLVSHDGFGLGHVRRNSLIARAILARDETVDVTVVTGLPYSPTWLGAAGARVVRVPPLLKDSAGGYRPAGMTFETAVDRRADIFTETITTYRPDVVVVDRHPYGTAGELRSGLEVARRQGARLVLGLRDILDEPGVMADELRGAGWDGAGDLFEMALVYGSRDFCDHEVEYGLPLVTRYCGWVTEQPPPDACQREPGLLAVTAGGGGDGERVFQLGLSVAERDRRWRVVIAAGPYAGTHGLAAALSASSAASRVELAMGVSGCGTLFGRASAVLEMAGYNSTFEALRAGHRPILVPRVRPRLEQLIRAQRLATLGVSCVVKEDADPGEVGDLLRRPRLLSGEHLRDAGITLDGASRAAEMLGRLSAGALR